MRRHESVIVVAPQTGDDDPTKVKLRRTDDYAFANFEMNEKGERTWMLMGADSDMNEIYLWTPDSKLFRKLIAEGKIKGTNDPKTKLDEEGKEVNVQNPGAVIDDPSRQRRLMRSARRGMDRASLSARPARFNRSPWRASGPTS